MSEDKTPQIQGGNKSPSEVVRKVIDKLQTDELEAQTSTPPANPAPTSVEPSHSSPNVTAQTSPSNQPAVTSAEPTMPNRERLTVLDTTATQLPAPQPSAPWVLEQFFSGEVDLDQELGKRLPHMPMLTTIQFRPLGTLPTRRVATLNTQDNSASMIVDVDLVSKAVCFSFTFGSMLTLRFLLDALSDADRTRWLELMRREEGGLAFLWNSSRWARDYAICISRKNHTNFYAFSPNQFEAGARIMPHIMKQLLDWLEEAWRSAADTTTEEPPLLTW